MRKLALVWPRSLGHRSLVVSEDLGCFFVYSQYFEVFPTTFLYEMKSTYLLVCTTWPL